MELNSHATMCQAGPGEAGSRAKLHLDQYTPWSSLEVLKAGLYGALGSLIWWVTPNPWQWGWSSVIFKDLSNLSHSVILCSACITLRHLTTSLGSLCQCIIPLSGRSYQASVIPSKHMPIRLSKEALATLPIRSCLVASRKNKQKEVTEHSFFPL